MSTRPAQNANCRQRSHALKKAAIEKDKAFYPEYRTEQILIQGDNTQTMLQDSDHPQLQEDLRFKIKKIEAQKRQINPQNGDQNKLQNNQEEGLFRDFMSQFEALLAVLIEEMKQKYCLQSSKIAHLKEKLKTSIPELIQRKCNQCIQFAGMNFYLNEEQSSFNLTTQKSKLPKKSIESFIKDQLQIKNQISQSRVKQEQEQVRRQQGEPTIQALLNHSSISEIQKVSYFRSSFSGIVLGSSPENDEVSTEIRVSMESIVEIQERHEWALKNRGVHMVEPNFSYIIRECKEQYSFLNRPPQS